MRTSQLLFSLPGVLLLFVSPVASALIAGAERTDVDAEVSFDQQIRPLLAENCFHCHGPDEAAREGGVRLDTREGAFSDLGGYRAVVPGAPAESDLYRRISTSDPDVRMPPPDSGRSLSDEQIALIRRWIAQGAAWSEHWAYQTPVRPEPPSVKDPHWPAGAIDFFILSRLEREGLSPSPPVDRHRLIRRVTLDLTGLPPSPQDVDRFTRDRRPGAYDRLVDRLLADPACGEHLARHWLDLARYADTNGYHIDTKRSIWPYRDWVIGAFSSNMPFDRFTIEQIAGDLLPEATLSQRIATGFHRNTMFNEEGGIDPEEFRTKAVVDRVSTTLTVWMGTTMACTECHDHKYDPFTQQEFYELYAFFNHVPETGGGTFKTPEPIVRLDPDPEVAAEIEQVRGEIERLSHEQPSDAEIAAELADWVRQLVKERLAQQWVTLDPTRFHSEGGATLTKLDDDSLLSEGNRPETDRYTVQAETDVQGITAIRLELLADQRLPQGGPGRHDNGNPVLSEFNVFAAETGEGNVPQPLSIKQATADFHQDGWDAARTIDDDPATGWALYPRIGSSHFAVFELEEDVTHPTGTTFSFELNQNYGQGALLGRFRLSVTTADRPIRADSGLPAHIAEIVSLSPGQRNDEQRQQLREYYLSTRPDPDAELKKRLAELEAHVPYSLVMAERDEPRKTFVHLRGNFLDEGPPVEADVPAVLPPLQPRGTDAADRLDLARWLVDADNPLTARVTMNRYWGMLFGAGLVKTAEDFGTQGERPSHPELLDWLATEFIRRQWDIKAMLRLMVTSETYRQSAAASPRLLEVDPDNRLYARGPRLRMDAEMMRDSALAVSGLLTRELGGPSVFPYQPAGLWEEKLLTGFGMGAWPTSTGRNQYRRGLYTFVRRSVPYPMFAVFDAPSREYCVVERPRTNTPLQSLATLNGPQFVEATRVFGQRALREGGDDTSSRIRYAFRLCLVRPPTEREVEALQGLLQRQLAHFRSHPDEAARLIDTGQAPRADDLEPAELAAWTVLGTVLLNVDESLTKG